MSKLIVDTIQRPGGAALSFPNSDGTAGQFLKTDASGNLSFGDTYTFPVVPGIQLAPEGKGIVGSISSTTYRQNLYSTGEWTSSGPWTTYTNYNAYTDNSLIQFINMALGDGYPTGTTQTWIGDEDRGPGPRALTFTNGNRLGHKRDMLAWDNATGYGGHTFRLMPIRNTTNAAITITLDAYCSNYWESGYEGICLFVLSPNSTTYSTVSSVNSTLIAQRTSGNSDMNGYNLNGTYSVPANTTVIVCLTNTISYQTTYRFKDTNYFNNLTTTFSNSGIICDMRMLTSLYSSQFNLSYSGGAVGTNLLAPLWTKTATNYGDR